jgi:predicted anti-sigma-YlaC factor YlaD
MSVLTFLVAISFLVVTATYVSLFCAKSANDLSVEIVTGVVRGTPISVGVREGMLFAMWLPYQFAIVILTAFVALATAEMADHVSGANVKLLAHLAAFLAGGTSVLVLATASIALFRYRAKLRRDRQRQAEAD